MSLQEAASAVVLGGAALGSMGLGVKWLRGGFKATEDFSEIRSMLGDLKRLVDHELTHNHGSSIKDDTVAAVVVANLAHQRIDAIEAVLKTFAEANHLVLPIIADAIHAQPPTERTPI